LLLQAIRELFEEKNADRLSSEDIVNRLANSEGSPWPEYRNGKPISMNQVANLLKDYKVHSSKSASGRQRGRGTCATILGTHSSVI